MNHHSLTGDMAFSDSGETQSHDRFFEVSWKRFVFPAIHFKGRVIVFCVAVALWGLLACFAPVWFVPVPLIVPLALFLFPLFVFGWYFFRNPERFPPDDEQAILAPADGLVCAIRTLVPPPTLGIGTEPLVRVSVFMSIFNVHVNRVPTSGRVCALTYHHGKFVNVAHKDSDDNERQEICIERADGVKIGFVQIAGLVARRIYCPLKLGDQVQAGAVFGLIRFGSRLDVYLPLGVEPDVLPGQTIIAGETVLARLGERDRFHNEGTLS